jgi:hypothetical protein
MWENRHLPAVGPTPEGTPIAFNVHQRHFGVLNELEKAHIYIERLHERVKTGEAEASRKDVRIADLEQRLARLESALATDLTGK